MKQSQNKNILNYLQKHKRITPIQALNKFGCFRLSARISDLEDIGHIIEHKPVTANKKIFMGYSLKYPKLY